MIFRVTVKQKKIINPYERIDFLERKFEEDISDSRFFPYIQLHEFETLVFVDPHQLADEYFNVDDAVENLQKMKEMVKNQNPELINDSPDNSPSKRILKLIPDYDKANIGPQVVNNIGLNKLRDACEHFNLWITQIEDLEKSNSSANKEIQ